MYRRLGATVGVVLLVGGVAHAQEQAGRVFTLRGTVVDTAYLPVPGALVYLSGAGVFSVSDEAGWFTLSDADAEPGDSAARTVCPHEGQTVSLVSERLHRIDACRPTGGNPRCE
jgi:hypothetical protein